MAKRTWKEAENRITALRRWADSQRLYRGVLRQLLDNAWNDLDEKSGVRLVDMWKRLDTLERTVQRMVTAINSDWTADDVISVYDNMYEWVRSVRHMPKPDWYYGSAALGEVKVVMLPKKEGK